MLSRRCMASDTATAKPKRPSLFEGWRRHLPGSRVGRLMVALNLLGLAVLIGGSLFLNEQRRGLIEARRDSLTTQGELISNVIAGAATRGSPTPMLEADRASDILQLLFIPRSQRARLFDAEGRQLADSYLVADVVERADLPPARKSGEVQLPQAESVHRDPQRVAAASVDLDAEVQEALRGRTVGGVRVGADGERVVSVSVPIQRVQAVLGVLTLEAADVDDIIAAQRRSMLPFILVAVGVTLTSSMLLSYLIAKPIRRLARAADRVRQARARFISLPDIARRQDEIGDLASSLEAMTNTLSLRMDAIERFAADVAHEIRNPLTSIRSAIDTLPLVSDPEKRERLMQILKNDIQRLDRLITDISNASRLDAELSRDSPRRIELGRLLSEIAGLYNDGAKPGEPLVIYSAPETVGPMMVVGLEGPLSQVFRNLIDNARSFSPAGGEVRVTLGHDGRRIVTRVEDTGPGIPPENLETVFDRFYTSRPKGRAFGTNSGLGLSIARQIVEAHSGRIWAENRAGPSGEIVGARFSVALPEART
jgi:two-component system, OmpR family, sensor histidine kinase ChvG